MRFFTRITVTLAALAAFPVVIASGCGKDTQNGTTTGASSSGVGGGESSSSGMAGAGGVGGASNGSGASGGNGGASASGGGGVGGSGNGGAGNGGAGNGGAGNAGGSGGSGASGSGGSAGAGSGGAGGSGMGGSGMGGSGGSVMDAGSDAGPIVFTPIKCLNQTYQCGDAVDNDMDGLTDWQDPDCLGPCDNTESSYYGGIPGQSGPACDVDCYWDANSGSGDDNCYWNHKCDPLESMPPGYPEPYAKCAYNPNTNISGTNLKCSDLQMQQPQTCLNFCLNITPNGCDCFGCCELPSGSGKYVWLGSEDASGNGSCTGDVINDPDKCKPCTPVPSCLNGCAKCEVCIGKPDLPPECQQQPDAGVDGGTPSQCPINVQPCGEIGQDPCPSGFYCITGCCKSLTGG